MYLLMLSLRGYRIGVSTLCEPPVCSNRCSRERADQREASATEQASPHLELDAKDGRELVNTKLLAGCVGSVAACPARVLVRRKLFRARESVIRPRNQLPCSVEISHTLAHLVRQSARVFSPMTVGTPTSFMPPRKSKLKSRNGSVESVTLPHCPQRTSERSWPAKVEWTMQVQLELAHPGVLEWTRLRAGLEEFL
jgi:hypothetical protein